MTRFADMRRFLILAASLCVAVTAGVEAQNPPAGQATPRPRPPAGPSADIQVHDPTLIRSGGMFYLFATGNGVSSWSSPDMKIWTPLPPVFGEAPAWISDVIPRFRNHMWAPDIYEHNGRYFLYYSVSSFGRNNSAIGVASNATLDPNDPRFRWTDHGMVVQSVPGRDMWNAIDSHMIRDEEGVHWMSFGSHWGGIKLVKMDTSLTRIAEPEEWRTIAARDRYWKLDERDAGDSANPELDYEKLYPERILQMNRASLSGAIEAPVILRKGDWYYLFVSWDRCCRGAESTYKVVVGRSKDVRGPYRDREGQDLTFGGGSLVIHGFGDGARYAAGGHNDAVTIDGRDYLVFHAYDTTSEGQSKLVIREITWDRWGWPIVGLD